MHYYAKINNNNNVGNSPFCNYDDSYDTSPTVSLGDSECGLVGTLRYMEITNGTDYFTAGNLCSSQCEQIQADGSCLLDHSITSCPTSKIYDSTLYKCFDPCVSINSIISCQGQCTKYV